MIGLVVRQVKSHTLRQVDLTLPSQPIPSHLSSAVQQGRERHNGRGAKIQGLLFLSIQDGGAAQVLASDRSPREGCDPASHEVCASTTGQEEQGWVSRCLHGPSSSERCALFQSSCRAGLLLKGLDSGTCSSPSSSLATIFFYPASCRCRLRGCPESATTIAFVTG